MEALHISPPTKLPKSEGRRTTLDLDSSFGHRRTPPGRNNLKDHFPFQNCVEVFVGIRPGMVSVEEELDGRDSRARPYRSLLQRRICVCENGNLDSRAKYTRLTTFHTTRFEGKTELDSVPFNCREGPLPTMPPGRNQTRNPGSMEGVHRQN